MTALSGWPVPALADTSPVIVREEDHHKQRRREAPGIVDEDDGNREGQRAAEEGEEAADRDPERLSGGARAVEDAELRFELRAERVPRHQLRRDLVGETRVEPRLT